ncbi:MAG: ABC transporter ATP-binding protein [Polyangiaceae bacterium]|nr:ABC transporter ATP-binding protein [Polyangiaceae bacterium]NUQ74026.1 ABC transporter ATP-binding protein [Polyangiaceae bacterium]
MLEAIGLSKHYGDFIALRGLDLRIAAGEVFCLLGANGAGKTTTIQLFLGFIEPTSGAAQIGGLNVAERAVETKALIAYIPENVMLYPNLTGLENLQFFTTLAGKPDAPENELRADLARAGLPKEAADRRVGTYSKGMRQKVGIAMAMAKGARALLLDEPTSGLDPKASNEFSNLLSTMRDDGVAVLMATHDIFRSKEVGDRVGIMKHGELVATLATGDFSHADLERIYLDHMHE